VKIVSMKMAPTQMMCMVVVWLVGVLLKWGESMSLAT
jgi:hypothetical protein